MCNVDYAEPATLARIANPKAAKDHRCDDCGRTIPKGETYRYATFLAEGSWLTCHVCQHCIAAGWWLNQVCGGWLYPAIGEETMEHWDEGYRDLTIGRLIVGHRRKWQRWDGTLMPIPRRHRVVWDESSSAYDRQILRYEAV